MLPVKGSSLPKLSKNGKKLGPRPEMGKKWFKNDEKIENDPKSHFFAIFGPFFPHFGPRAIFYFLANFSHFWISARFPFYARRPDSQSNQGRAGCWCEISRETSDFQYCAYKLLFHAPSNHAVVPQLSPTVPVPDLAALLGCAPKGSYGNTAL